jgi:hypothetical protein
LLPAFLFLLPAAFLFSSCSDDSNGTGPDDPTGAAEKVRQANASLEQILFDELNADDPERPGDVDFRAPHGLYRDALELDPNNLDAHFGTAVTGLLILSADAEVNAAFDEWKEYLDERIPFEAESSARSPLGVPLAFRPGPDALRLPYELVPMSVLALAPLGRLDVDPQIERAQAILEDRVLPKAEAAIAHLDRVAASAGYVFTVTPRMQGDEDEDAAEIDRTDILALRAGCSLLAAACHVAVSYNLGFAAYDSLHLHQALTPGSGWLTLKSGGADHMEAAQAFVLDSIDDVDAAITSLLGEADSQTDDVIKIGPDDLARADVESVQVHLPDVREAMTGGHTRIDDWDGDSHTPDAPLTANVGAIFTDPVPDWKALLPAYSVSVVRKAVDSSWYWTSGDTTALVDIPVSDYYSGYYTLYVWADEQDEYYWGDEVLKGALRAMVEGFLAEAGSMPGWTGDFSGTATVAYQWCEQGIQPLSVSWSWDCEVADREVFIPVIVWDAGSFDEWVLPDPTLHGLLPEIGSTSEIWTLFGIGGWDWEREWVIDWTDEGDMRPPWGERARP